LVDACYAGDAPPPKKKQVVYLKIDV